jgi:hypothetical protein
MKRNAVFVICCLLACALIGLLFPFWKWRLSEPGHEETFSGWYLRFSPPTPFAKIDDWDTWTPLVTVFLVSMPRVLYVFRARVSDKEAAAYWNEKWEYVGEAGNTLLRASAEETSPQSDTLLRGADSTTTVTPILMVRARTSPDRRPADTRSTIQSD